ncbi:MAG: MerR family transcriptional regulator [Chloroflexi bacterium]|nr:MerR family transcriptional regulator [Chloroflexota bacterium]
MRSTHLLPIGEVAKTTGIAVSAVRYYEEIGIISAVTRVGGKRRFSPNTVGRVNFVLRAREAGFCLDDIRTILDDTAGGWRDLVESKLTELTGRRERIDTMIAMVAEIRDCGCGAVATCPLVSSF